MEGQDGFSALKNMGVITKPIGTLEEIRKVGYDPEKTASCAPPSPGVMACSQWNNCIFANPMLGGFKGQGPRYVGYRLITDDGKAQENDCRCFVFMRHLRSRMVHGQKERLDGRRGDFVRIIAQEGEMIKPRVAINKNFDRPNAKPDWENIVKERPVHRFPRPGEVDDRDYDAAMIKAEEEAQKEETAVMQQAAELRAAPDDDWNDDEVILGEPDVGQKKRGRPKGSKNKASAEPE